MTNGCLVVITMSTVAGAVGGVLMFVNYAAFGMSTEDGRGRMRMGLSNRRNAGNQLLK